MTFVTPGAAQAAAAASSMTCQEDALPVSEGHGATRRLDVDVLRVFRRLAQEGKCAFGVLMTTQYSLSRSGFSALAASLLLCTGGCAAKPPPAPLTTSAEVEASPQPQPPVVVVVSPNVNVSAELAAACTLRFNDAATAPKFDFDRSKLGTDDNVVLSQIAECVMTGPLKGRSLTLVGRADPRGKGEYNMALGERRAGSVGDYLMGAGVDSSTLFETSRGKLDAKGTDANGWQLDRRVDILLR